METVNLSNINSLATGLIQPLVTGGLYLIRQQRCISGGAAQAFLRNSSCSHLLLGKREGREGGVGLTEEGDMSSSPAFAFIHPETGMPIFIYFLFSLIILLVSW